MAIIAPDLGIDLGSSNTQIYVRRKGLEADEPTILAVTKKGKRVVRAIGEEARNMLGRTAEDVAVVQPVSNGRINDFDMAGYYLEEMIRKAIGSSMLIKPRAVMTVPCRINPLEMRTVYKAAFNAGIRKGGLFLIEKPFAAACGCGLPVFEPKGCMIVDIGGGTTEAAVISYGGIVVSRSIDTGGIKMSRAIIDFFQHTFNLRISERTAESLKQSMGSALPLKENRMMEIRGLDLITNLPQDATVSSKQIYESLQGSCREILDLVRDVLSFTPPELCSDVLESGVFLTGGGSQLFAIDQFIEAELGMKAHLTQNPGLSAALGAGRLVEDLDEVRSAGAVRFRKETSEE